MAEVVAVRPVLADAAVLDPAVFDSEIAGDDESVPIVERAESRRVIDEPDVRKKIELYVDGFVRRQQRRDCSS